MIIINFISLKTCSQNSYKNEGYKFWGYVSTPYIEGLELIPLHSGGQI